MKQPTDMVSRIVIENGLVTRIIKAVYDKKGVYSEIDVYKEDENNKCYSQNLYTSMYCGHVVAFPGMETCGNPFSYFYDTGIAEEMGWDETSRRLSIGWGDRVTDSMLKSVYSVYPNFKYLVNKYPDAVKDQRDFMTYLQIWKKHPELELVLAAGFEKVGTNGNFWRLNKEHKKEICNFMRKFPQYSNLNLRDVQACLKAGCPEKFADYLDCVPSWRRPRTTYEIFTYLRKLQKKINEKSLIDIEHLIRQYDDYISMARFVGHDVNQNYWKFPKDLHEAHDIVMEEQERVLEAQRLQQEAQRKAEAQKKVKDLMRVVRKYAFKDCEIDGFRVFVTADYDTWRLQADTLHQCILACGYMDKMAKKNCVIVFIQKEGVPVATAEIKKDGTVGQFYANEMDRNNCLPSDEVKEVFQKWLAIKKPRKSAQNKKVLEVA